MADVRPSFITYPSNVPEIYFAPCCSYAIMVEQRDLEKRLKLHNIHLKWRGEEEEGHELGLELGVIVTTKIQLRNKEQCTSGREAALPRPQFG
jgi:hypothetical protein